MTNNNRILILLLISIFSKISNKGDFLVFDLDEKVENRNKDNLSVHLKKYLSQGEAIYNITNKNVEIDEDVDSINNTEVFLNDQKIISIPSIDFKYKGYGINYKIDSEIDPEIIPNDYFKGKDTKMSNDYHIKCKYVNKAPKYDAKLYEKFNITSFVTNGRINFGLDTENKIVVFKMHENGTALGHLRKLDHFYIDKKIANIKFRKLLIVKQLLFEDFRQYLCAIAKDEGKIYVFELYDGDDEDINTSMRYFDFIDYEREYERNNGTDIINAISFDYTFFYVATKTEYFLMYERVYDMGSPYLFSRKFYDFYPGEHSRNILDLVSVHNTLYLLEEGKGISIFDNINVRWLPVIIPHPFMKKLDHILFDVETKASTLFMGAIIDNHPSQGVNEILVEYIISGSYEEKPIINKIFTSKKKIEVDHVVTDIINKYTYVLEKNNNDLFILNRGIPNFIKTYHYSINLNQYPHLQERFYSKLTFFAFDKLYYKYSLLFTNMDGDYYFMKNITNVSQNLFCDFKYRGHFDEYIQIYGDCRNTVDMVEYELDGCNNSIVYTIGIKKGPTNTIIQEKQEKIKEEKNKFIINCSFALAAIFIFYIMSISLCCKSKKDKDFAKKNI